jgi:hypothetical protein
LEVCLPPPSLREHLIAGAFVQNPITFLWLLAGRFSCNLLAMKVI